MGRENDRVVPDTDLAGYPANSFVGYRISDFIVNIEFFFQTTKTIEIFSF